MNDPRLRPLAVLTSNMAIKDMIMTALHDQKIHWNSRWESSLGGDEAENLARVGNATIQIHNNTISRVP